MEPEKRRAVLLGAGAFVFALLVRLIGIGWGLPSEQRYQSLHPDEPVIYLYSQQIEPAKLDFAPGFYNYGTLYLTVLRVAGDVVEAYSGPTEDSEAGFWLSVGSVHMAGRLLSALAGAGTVWLVFLMLWPRAGQAGALFGAAAMALAPGHVVHSRFETVDVLATFFLAASLYFSLRLVAGEDRPLRLAVWAGVFAGLSAGTKYTGILALVALLVVALVVRRDVALKLIGASLLSSLLVFFLVTPGALVETGAFVRDFKYEMTHTQIGHGLVFAGTPSGFLYHLQNLSLALGGFATLLGAFGLVRAAWKRHSWAFALLAFGLAYYVLIGRAEVKFLRYVFPLLPVLCVGFGWLMARALQAFHDDLRPMKLATRGLAGVLGVLGLAAAARYSALYSIWMSQEDVRDEVARELRDESDEGTTVGLPSDPWFYTPPFYPQSATGPWANAEQRFEWMARARNPRVVRYLPDNVAERFDWDVRLLTELGPDYVVFSSFEIGDLNRINQLPSPPSEYKTQLGRAEEFMDTLQTLYERVKVRGREGGILPHDLMYIRPEVQVWKRKSDSSSPSSSSSTTSAPSGERAPTP
jgi:hypothetical protein